MKYIKLSQGKYAIVDNEDYDWLNQWKWTYDGRYAHRRPKGKKIYMHRLINHTPDGVLTDHINNNKLDNRKENLRICNKQLNALNRLNVGVSLRKDTNRWRAYININGKQITLGCFAKKDDALMARRDYCLQIL